MSYSAQDIYQSPVMSDSSAIYVFVDCQSGRQHQSQHQRHRQHQQHQPIMECVGPANTNGLPTTATAMKMNSTTNGDQGSGKTMNTKQHSGTHVNFDVVPPAVVERKKKFLTAKYGTHQMSLIKKRLGVEMWMYDEIQFLFGVGGDESTDECEVELDLDELLDIDDENGRKNWLKEKLLNAKQSPETVKKFIDELISRAKTL